MIPLPNEFKEFLKCLNDNQVDYLLIGGYAVVYHGYPRYTGDMDIWIDLNNENADKTVRAIEQFGFDVPAAWAAWLRTKDHILRMGVPPMRIEVLTGISGVTFADCRPGRVIEQLDDLLVPVIALSDLIKNKKASGRTKDLNDVENLPVR